MSYLMCRLCLSNDALELIFCKTEEIVCYSENLLLTTGLQISPNDGFPQHICSECKILVKQALFLRKRSSETELKLLQLGFAKTPLNACPQNGDEVDETNIASPKSLPSDTHEFITENVVSATANDFFEDLLPELEVKVELDRLTDLDVKQELSFTNEPTVSGIQPQKTSSKKERRKQYLSLVEGRFSKNGPVTCKVCKKTLSKWATFISHAKIHLGFKFVCEFCGKSFISTTQLNRHCRSYHGKEKEIQCQFCEFLAIDKYQLELHERRFHTGVRPFICDVCNSSYFSRRCLLQHLESHNPDNSIQCPKCPQMLKSRRHLARHTYTAHTITEYIYKCPVCKNTYNSRKYARVHLNKQHGPTTNNMDIIKIKK